jgi:P-type E1-E2 ATPase
VCTNQLICGTIIYVNENFKLPADCVLLEGECLVDEAALTGESIPAIKHRIEHTFEDIGLKKRNILYEGTTIL